jgi:hypothetical protein
MTDPSLPEGLIEAVALALYIRSRRGWGAGLTEAQDREARHAFGVMRRKGEAQTWVMGAEAALSAAFSWRDDKPCPNSVGYQRNCTDGPGGCSLCGGFGRVEGDRRVILARQVGWGFKIAPPVLGLFPWTFSELRDETDGVPMFVATPAQEAERGEPS